VFPDPAFVKGIRNLIEWRHYNRLWTGNASADKGQSVLHFAEHNARNIHREAQLD
jgi:hypothetical protein